MKNYNIGCLFFLFMLTCVRTYAQDPNFHIYLCLGQSNMGGSARFETQDTISVNNRFQVLQAVDCVELNRKREIGMLQNLLYAAAIPAYLLQIILEER